MEKFIVFQKQNNKLVPVSVTGEIYNHSVKIKEQNGSIKDYNSGGIDLQKILVSDVLLAELQDYNLSVVPIPRTEQYAENKVNNLIEAEELKYQSFINSLKTSISTIQNMVKTGQKLTPAVLQKIKEIKQEFSEPIEKEIAQIDLASIYNKPVEMDIEILGKNHNTDETAMLDTGAQICLFDSSEFSKKLKDQNLTPYKEIYVSGIEDGRIEVPVYDLKIKVRKGNIPNSDIEIKTDFGLLNGLKNRTGFPVLLDCSVFNYIRDKLGKF